MKATFEIEWPDDNGESWMNVWNLLTCLTATCRGTEFIVRGTDAQGTAVEASGSEGAK